jgi:hypothetical protein
MNNFPNNITIVQLRSLDAVNLARARATSKKLRQVIDGNRNLRNRIDRFDRAVKLVLTSDPIHINSRKVRQSTVRQVVQLLRERRNNLPQNRASAQRFIENAIATRRLNRGPKYRTITYTNKHTGEVRRVSTEIKEPIRNYSRPRR